METLINFLVPISEFLAEHFILSIVVNIIIFIVNFFVIIIRDNNNNKNENDNENDNENAAHRYRGPIVLFIVLFVILFANIFIQTPHYSSPVFKSAVESKYGKLKLTEIKRMTSLDLSYGNDNKNQLDNISDITMFSGLTSLNLANNNISDIGCLSSLPLLTELNIRQNHTLSDISVVAYLHNLTRFTAYSCNIQDITPLSNCPLLEHVSLGNNEITDVSPLFGLVKLNEIKIHNLDIPNYQKDTLKTLFPNAVFEW